MEPLLRSLVVNDLHVPYHDPRAIDLAVRVVEVWMPDQVIFNGDIGDFYAVSQYDKDPARLMDGGLQEEVNQVRRILRRFKAALERRTRIKTVLPKRRIIVKPGNHEDRLRRYLWKHPELYGMSALQIPELYGLREEDIEYEEDDTILANGALHLSHGTRVRQKAGYTATAELEAVMYGYGTKTGHTHRLGTVYARTPDGYVSASEGGCLCLDSSYVRKPNWQLGVTTIYSSMTTREYHVFSVPFVNYACMIEGKRISV